MTRPSLVLLAPVLFAQESAEQVRSAAARSVTLLQKGAAVDEAGARVALMKPLTHMPNLSSIDQVVQANMIIDPASSDGAALIAGYTAGLKPGLTTGIEARLIANPRRADRHWGTIDARPPREHSQFAATATAVRAMQLYMPEELRKEAAERALRAKAWFLKAAPATTEDYTFPLVGLAWSGAGDAERATALRVLRGLRRPTGGWAQMPRMEPDAYETGEALAALREAGGVPVTDPAWRKGLQYLMSTQNADGSWRVHTRMVSPAQVSPPYFESGLPFGHDQFISSAGTSYAAMALMLALDKAAKPAPAPGLAELEPKGVQPWMRAALFGTAAELKSLLDRGLDPNCQTEGYTPLLYASTVDYGDDGGQPSAARRSRPEGARQNRRDCARAGEEIPVSADSGRAAKGGCEGVA